MITDLAVVVNTT